MKIKNVLSLLSSKNLFLGKKLLGLCFIIDFHNLVRKITCNLEVEMNGEIKNTIGGFLQDFDLGELRQFSLNDIVNVEKKELLQLVLTFCVVFDDIKDYLWINDQLLKSTEQNERDQITPKRGQVAGMKEHCRRALIASFLEFLQIIENHIDVIEGKDFGIILEIIAKKIKDSDKMWKDIVKLAKGGEDFEDDFYKTLIKIRNTGTYHYKHTKAVYQGLEYYIEKKDNLGFISLGNTTEETRFYFGDAAIQFYHLKITDQCENFDNKLAKYLRDVLMFLRFFIECYLTRGLAIKLKAVESSE